MIDPRISEATELLTRALTILSELQRDSSPETLERIVNATAEDFRVDRSLIFRHTKVEEAIRARQVSMYLAHLNNRNVNRLAVFFDRSRNSIVYSLKQVQNHLETNRKFRERVFKLRDTLGLKP